MKSICAILIALTISLPCFAQFTAQINPQASVIFPNKPKEMQEQGQQLLYNTLDRENKVTGMATAIDAAQFGVDSVSLVANYNNTMFIDLILQNLVGQYSGMKLVSKKKITVGKMMGYEVTFSNDAPTEEVPYKNIYAQVCFAGTNIYALTVLAQNKVDATTERDKFFRSLKVE